MDSSKILEDNEECSSNESGWTMYIASPDHELDYDDYDDDEDFSSGEQIYKKAAKKDAEDVDSDDSMASDASSGPSYQGHSFRHVGRFHSFGHGHAVNERESKYVDKKHHKQEERKHDEQRKKAAKDKYGHKKNSAGRSKNK